ncbi:MAG: cysteinyl-tRNA synthetase [Candidatus Deianiraeaceae bacterium]|jgi:cysteinyl-tRNA synthetase
MNITLFNTLSNKEEEIIPTQEGKISMYVCGPTVYDTPHIGNARSNIFYDLLFRIFRSIYKEVVYVRNITDVDDKIIKRANEEGIKCEDLTKKTIQHFHEDLIKMNCIPPTHEPHATQFIPQMVKMIQKLVHNGYAYEAHGDYFFSVKKFKEYGALSKKKLEDLIVGSRVNIKSYKHAPEDFALWKSAPKEEYGFETALGYGRPGWHIECATMSTHILGDNFEIHGGGIDLQFPHHENEIAQSCCANIGSSYAKYWVHNGFLKVNGEKMSKSLGNFLTIDNVTQTASSSSLRLCLLATHYRKPLDFNDHSLKTAEANIKKFNKALTQNEGLFNRTNNIKITDIPLNAKEALLSNINISKYLAIMHALPKDIQNTNDAPNKHKLAQEFWNMGALIGIFI